MQQQDSDTTRCSATSQDTPAPSVDEPWQWWFSQDRERWQGPHGSRDEAIAEALGHYEAAPFYICQAYQADHRQIHIDSSDVLERLADHYDDLGDPDGDPLFSEVTREQERDLERRLDQALYQWIVDHKINLGVYAFANTRGEERISPQPERVSPGDTSNTDPSPQTTPAQSAES